jgi:hypothetical protein
MLLTLWKAGYITLEPEPPKEEPDENADGGANAPLQSSGDGSAAKAELARPRYKVELFPNPGSSKEAIPGSAGIMPAREIEKPRPPLYLPDYARPTDEMQKLHLFRGIHPLYAVFLVNQLGIADRAERLQAMESVLELPRSIGPAVRVPLQKDLPPGPLATLRLDPLLLQLGLATAEELTAPEEPEEYQPRRTYDEAPVRVLTFADKLRKLFDYDFPNVRDLRTYPVWAAGELLEFGGDFNKYITSKNLHKQEGLIFRHLLRLILLVKEFEQLSPPDISLEEWQADLRDIAARLTECCRQVDPASTDKALEEIEGESADEATQ